MWNVSLADVLSSVQGLAREWPMNLFPSSVSLEKDPAKWRWQSYSCAIVHAFDASAPSSQTELAQLHFAACAI